MSNDKQSNNSYQTPPQVQYPYYYQQENKKVINLLDILKVLYEYKISIALITTISTAIALAVALLATPIFRAETLLAPVSKENDTGYSTMASQFGGLASLAGINFSTSRSNVDETIAILKSRDFTIDFIQEEKLLPVLFAEYWDVNIKQWKKDYKQPTLLNGYKLFNNEIRSISVDKATGFITLAIDWHDPKKAAEWVSMIVDRINSQLRNEAIIEAENSIQYLEKELERTSVIEVKQSIYNLIEAQQKNKMLANTRQEYAFVVIDKAVVPEEKIKPKRKFIIVYGFTIGLMLGVVLAFLRRFIKNLRSSETVSET